MNNQQTIDEVYEIIIALGDERKKIPQNVVKFFEDNSTKPFKEKLDLSKGLVNQNFSKSTNAFIKYIAEYFK